MNLSRQWNSGVGESANTPRSPERGGWFTQATPPVSHTEAAANRGRYFFFDLPFFGIFVRRPGRRPSVHFGRALLLFQSWTIPVRFSAFRRVARREIAGTPAGAARERRTRASSAERAISRRPGAGSPADGRAACRGAGPC